MLTGQISSQALQVVQAHTSSAVIRSSTEPASTLISGSTVTGGATFGEAVAAITSPTLRTISRGSSGLPVLLAGQTEVQRPQMVQASVSISCFQVKSSIFDAPKESSSVSIRLGSGFMAPLGRGRSRRYMFIGDVNMWRSLVVGSRIRNVRKPAKCRPHTARCTRDRVEADQWSKPADRGQPMIDHFSNAGRPTRAMRSPSTRKPVTPMRRKTPRMTASSGFVLVQMR